MRCDARHLMFCPRPRVNTRPKSLQRQMSHFRTEQSTTLLPAVKDGAAAHVTRPLHRRHDGQQPEHASVTLLHWRSVCTQVLHFCIGEVCARKRSSISEGFVVHTLGKAAALRAKAEVAVLYAPIAASYSHAHARTRTQPCTCKCPLQQ